MENEFDKTGFDKEAFASANASPRHDEELDNYDNDISQILHGAKAITGKAIWSANGTVAMQREESEQKEKQHHEQIEAEETRELAHLAEWNAQMTTMGGVSMTNEEAQRCRQHIIDNEDYYAYKARQEGRIYDGEEEDYKHTVRRIHELEEKRGRGISTKDEDKECERLKESRMGKITEHDAAEARMEGKDYKATANKTAAQENSVHTGLLVAKEDNLFQSAPDMSAHFQKATTAPTPEKDRTLPLPDPKIAATGLNI